MDSSSIDLFLLETLVLNVLINFLMMPSFMVKSLLLFEIGFLSFSVRKIWLIWSLVQNVYGENPKKGSGAVSECFQHIVKKWENVKTVQQQKQNSTVSQMWNEMKNVYLEWWSLQMKHILSSANYHCCVFIWILHFSISNFTPLHVLDCFSYFSV